MRSVDYGTSLLILPVLQKTDVEYIITWVAFPALILLLVMGRFAAKYENYPSMVSHNPDLGTMTHTLTGRVPPWFSCRMGILYLQTCPNLATKRNDVFIAHQIAHVV